MSLGENILNLRKKKGLSKTGLCRKLELLGVEFDRNEIYRIENYRMSVKDFELIAFATVLDIDFNLLKKEIDDVTRQTISNWELEETSPNPAQLKQLSKALDVSIDDLLNNDINNILVEKVSNTEKLAGIAIKTLKFIGSAFLVLLAIDIISFIIFMIIK